MRYSELSLLHSTHMPDKHFAKHTDTGKKKKKKKKGSKSHGEKQNLHSKKS
jgi:hypothetical protein